MFDTDAMLVRGSFLWLHQKLGEVPLERISLDPPPGMATERDVLRHLEDKLRGRLYELVDGTLVEKKVGVKETIMADYLLRKLGDYVESHDLGLTCGGAGPVRMLLGNVRMPDVSFFSWATLPNEEMPNEPVCPIAPVLAVEVLSPSNTRKEMEIKRNDLFPSGTKLMWIIDPKTRTAEIYTSAKKCKVIDAKGILDGAKVIPGFLLPLNDVFESLKRIKPKPKDNHL